MIRYCHKWIVGLGVVGLAIATGAGVLIWYLLCLPVDDGIEMRFSRLRIGMDERRAKEILGEPTSFRDSMFHSEMTWKSDHLRINVEFGFGGISEGRLFTNDVLTARISENRQDLIEKYREFTSGSSAHRLAQECRRARDGTATAIDIASDVGLGASGGRPALACSLVVREELRTSHPQGAIKIRTK
jgi:hypothetical protein